MIRVGLTGNIGSGKTLVGKIFRILGAPVFQADTAARDLYKLTEVKRRLSEITGEHVFDTEGNVDHKKLAGLIFSDGKVLDKVNQLIHPLVRKVFTDYTSGLRDKPYIIYEAAILIESGYYRELDKLILVHAPADIRIGRVMDRDLVSKEEVLRRARFQADAESSLHLADWVVYNDGSRMVIPQVLMIDQELRSLQSNSSQGFTTV